MAKAKPKPLPEPFNVLRRIKRGLAGHVSYLAACEMNEAFSEYVLYEPILRILLARGYAVKSEVKAPVPQPKKGDKRKLDFVVVGNGLDFAIEVKWAKRRTINIEEDMLKLSAYQNKVATNRAFLCVFGLKRFVDNIRFRPSTDPALVGVTRKEIGKAMTAAFGQTTYCCRFYEVL